jgi:hypothetical protein
VLCAAALVSCSPAPAPEPTASRTTTATATPSPTPSGPVLVPEGTAADNLPLFADIMDRVWATDNRVKGRAYIDALVRAGFEKSAMEVTKDRSSVGIAADSIQFSVLWEKECLVGQVGPSTKRPTAVVLPELPSGGCLVGETRPIDW